ncbi:hypothetical protein [Nocardia sp. NPDC047654]|uniref:hypothetical protein n=1 Tax=Nocardia sp. NPDC047654 TaxID=3364314 RepID=UPI00371B3860
MATVNAALREVANQRAVSKTLQQLRASETEFSAEAARDAHRLTIPDLILSATAEVHRATVLHVGSDYQTIADITGQPHRRLGTS